MTRLVTTSIRAMRLVAAALGVLVLGDRALAQGVVLGEFRWQVQPYCNVLTLTVVQLGTQFRLEGTDDQCGAARRAAATGLAFPNPDGTIGLGVTVLMTPGAIPWHLDITLDASVNGTWRDATGQSGAFRLTPGNGTGGLPRPQVPPLNLVVDHPASDDVGGWPSVATTADGRPLVSHFNATSGALRFTRCLDRECHVAASRDIDSVAGHIVGRFTALAIGSDGLPVISHQDQTVGALRVTHCDDLGCTSATSLAVDADPAFQLGSATALAVGQDGFPVIAHTLSSAGISGGLRVTHCTDVRCTTSTSRIVEIPSLPQLVTGLSPAIAIGADGLPVITHGSVDSTIKGSLEQLRLTRCLDVSCSTSTSTSRTSGGRSSAIVILGGTPFIVADRHYRFFSGSFGDGLTMLHCQDLPCSTSTSSGIVVPPADETSSLAVGLADTGLPVVAYSSALAALRVVRCNDADCTTRDVAIVDATPTPQELSLAVPTASPRYPVIAYRDLTARALRVVICRSSGCQ